MKDKLRYGNSVIEYTIVKSKRRKTSEILVDESGVEVRTPILKKDSEIKQMIEGKKKWIFKKHLEFSDRVRKQKLRKTRTFTAMELENRVWKLASKIDVKPSKIVIKELKGRWGSATKEGVINLNSALLEAPSKVVDYVIIHELCHLIVREHSKQYWSLVYRFMPNYELQLSWLNNKKVI